MSLDLQKLIDSVVLVEGIERVVIKHNRDYNYTLFFILKPGIENLSELWAITNSILYPGVKQLREITRLDYYFDWLLLKEEDLKRYTSL